MDIYLSDSMSSIRRKIETYEEESIQRQQQQQEQQVEAQREATQAQAESAQADRETDMQKTLIKAETDITTAQISADASGDSGEAARANIERLKKDWEEMNKKYALEGNKLAETTRHNKATEVIDKKKAMQKPVKTAN
jgi:hypothetical protein